MYIEQDIELILTKEKSAILSVGIFFLYTFYCDLIERIPHNSFAFALMIISLMFATWSMVRENELKLPKSLCFYTAGWLIFYMCFVLVRNRWVEHGLHWRTVRMIWAFMMLITVAKKKELISHILRIVLITGFPTVMATIFFYIFRGAYAPMRRVWGGWPPGTDNGRLGYKAGLCKHYSANAIMLSIVVLCAAAVVIYIMNYQKNGARQGRTFQKKICFSVFFLLSSLFALFLTAKRGHVLFSITTIAFGYILSMSRLKLKNVLFAILLFVIITLVVVFVYRRVPELNKVVERFSTVGEDSSSTSRLVMWSQAWRIFKSHAFLGIGWGGFRYVSVYQLEAHNVYFQLLAETGIFGFAFYMYNIVKATRLTLRNISKVKRHHFDENLVQLSIFTSFIQMFYLLYSLTGNVLYDITFNFYAISLGMSYSVYKSCGS